MAGRRAIVAALAVATALAIAAGLAGCAGEPTELALRPAPTAMPTAGMAATARQVSLTPDERKAVEDAVASMLTPHGNIRFGPLKAARASGSDGGAGRLQVCGYVAYERNSGETQPMTRYYVEFKPGTGTALEAIRGQIASAPEKASKIAFVCNKYGLS